MAPGSQTEGISTCRDKIWCNIGAQMPMAQGAPRQGGIPRRLSAALLGLPLTAEMEALYKTAFPTSAPPPRRRLSLDPERSQGLIAGAPGSQSPGQERGLRLEAWKEGRRSAWRPTPPHPALRRYLAKLSSVGSISEGGDLREAQGPDQRQVQVCKRNLEVMDSVRRGAARH